MEKIVQLSKDKRISIESEVIKCFWGNDRLILIIKGSLERGYEGKKHDIWVHMTGLEEQVERPNLIDKLRKINWSDKAINAENRIVNKLKIIHIGNLKIDELNQGLYESLNGVK